MLFASHYYDVPAQVPNVQIPLHKVSVINQKVLIYFEDELFGKASAQFNVRASVSLSAVQRGVHMSRIEQAFQNLPSNKRLCEIALIIAQRIVNTQNQASASVELVGDVILPGQTNVTRLASHNILSVIAGADVTPTTTQMRFGLGATIMSVCPCMQIYAVEEMVRAFGLSVDDPYDITNQIPVATHSQKGKVMMIFSVPTGDNLEVMNYQKIYDIYKQSVHLTSELLKRPDEYDMVKRAHLRPQFVEDVIRDVLSTLHQTFLENPPDLNVFVCAESYESIHGHDIEAELNISLSELRQLLKP